MRKNKKVAILLSRQNLRPCLGDRWVESLISAVSFVKQQGSTLLTSVGTRNWEIVTACARLAEVPFQVIMPDKNEGENAAVIESVTREFELDKVSLCFIHPPENTTEQTKERLWKSRDMWIVNSADVLMPVSVRPHGFLEALIQKAAEKGVSIVNDFRVPYIKHKPQLSYTIRENELAKGIKSVTREYIIHWTRSSNTAWPNESKLDFYKDILKFDVYPRSAFHTLQNIVRTATIYASSKNMPGKIATVSFSAIAPTEAIKLMRWRARHRQMSFEPYGIGIEKQAAQSLGICEVEYCSPGKRTRPATNTEWLRQSIGQVTDWRHEMEWRAKGDFDLSTVPKEKLILICDRRSEAVQLENETGLATVWFRD